MNLENRMRIVAASLLIAALALAGSPAWAGGGGNTPPTSRACGKFVMKLHNFGKRKLRDYNSYVPEIYQADPGTRLKPAVVVFFFDDGTFTMGIPYPTQTGELTTRIVTGTYTRDGKKLKFKLDAAGEAELGLAFSDLSENDLFGDLERVTDIPYVDIKLGSMKFKGKINGNGLKIKFKTDLKYDIQYQNNSENADQFNLKGRFKLRAKGSDCDS